MRISTSKAFVPIHADKPPWLTKDYFSLPGADRIAKRTGAIVIANGEAINVLRQAGVPDTQLLPVGGGERVPLFTRADRQGAAAGTVRAAVGPPGAPARPHHDHAVMSVHVWPSLHCLMPGETGHPPDEMDTATVYTGEANPYVCTLDITMGMKHGLLRIGELMPPDRMDEGTRSFVAYIADRERHVMSAYDGGQLAFNLLIGPGKTLFWSGHLGAYQGVVQAMEPKPNVAILAVAGRANLNGRPYDGSAADFITEKIKWLGEPETVIWCLHDESYATRPFSHTYHGICPRIFLVADLDIFGRAIKPWRVDTAAATDRVQRETSSRVKTLTHAMPTELFA